MGGAERRADDMWRAAVSEGVDGDVTRCRDDSSADVRRAAVSVHVGVVDVQTDTPEFQSIRSSHGDELTRTVTNINDKCASSQTKP